MKLKRLWVCVTVAWLLSAVGVPSAFGVPIPGIVPPTTANVLITSQIALLPDWFGGQNDYLGSAVAAGGDTALVGAPPSSAGARSSG